MNRLHYHNFSFLPPANWADLSTILWVSPPNYGTTPETSTQELIQDQFEVESQKRRDFNMSPMDYLQARVRELKRGLQHFKEIESPKICSLGGCEGARVAYSLVVEEIEARQDFVVLFSGDWIFHLTATAALARYPQVSDTFETMFQSFRLT